MTRTALHGRDVPRHRGSSRGIAASTTALRSTAPTPRVTSCASTAMRCATRSRSTAPKRERSRVAIRRSRTVFDAPALDRSFGSMAEQRTTNAPGGASCQRRALADCWPERSDGAPKKTPYVVQKMRHFNRERVPERVVHADWAAPTRCTTRAGADMDGRARHAKDDDFGQAGTLVRDALDDAERDRMVSNIVRHVSQDVSDDVQGRMIGYWSSVDVNLGARVAAGLGCGAGQRAARRTDSTRNVRNSLVPGEAPGHEAPRPRLCSGSLLALTASYFYGARRDRPAGEDDR